MSTIDDWIEKGRMADGVRMSDERLDEVFNLVKNPEHWKERIDASVPKELATRAEIEAAVVWFAGGAPYVIDKGDYWLVEGAGYYEWIGS